MNKKEIQDHKEVAAGMEWCDLASIIIDLEMERAELEEHYTEKDIKKYNTLLKIYEDEKLERVQNLTTYVSWFF